MKALLPLPTALAVLCALVLPAAATTEIVPQLKVLAPGEEEDWKDAGALELQARFWGSEHVAVALAGGFQFWSAPSEFVEEWDATYYGYNALEGHALLVPIGVSMLYRSDPEQPFGLLCELGVRYVFVQSDVYAETYIDEPAGTTFWEDTIDIDNTLVAVAGIGVRLALGDGMSMQAGLEIQKDLRQPAETWLDENLGDTSFDAAGLTVAVGWEF